MVGNEMGYEGKLLLENALRPEATSMISKRCWASMPAWIPFY